MAEKTKGYVEQIVFRNEENGYTVLSLQTAEDEITCVGIFPQIHAGEFMEVEGERVTHPVYGDQLKVSVFHTKMPDEKAAFERYLGSGAIKGIGEKLAERILRHFGEETQEILEHEPERLSEVKGISEKKAADISGQLAEKSQLQNALIFLAQYGISYQMGLKIYREYRDGMYQILKENPYRLAEDVAGIGFKTADQIAERTGIRKDSEYRIKSGILYCLSKASADGHTYLPIDRLHKEAEALLLIEFDLIEKYLMDLSIEKKVILRTEDEQTLVYSAQTYFIELNTARMLEDLNIQVREDGEHAKAQLERLEKADRISLDALQKEAILAAARSGLVVITGGPGTGKTTTINTMIRYFETERMGIALAAPTGRAARRMQEAAGYAASTIHRLLEVSGREEDGGQFERNQDNPIEADVVIIDEMSMVDIFLMHSLLLALVPGTRLILVGDVNQLPSVGPGSVLKDIIRSNCCEVVRLTHIFRQAAESDIVMNAHKIHAGELIEADNKSKDFFFLERDDTNIILHSVKYLVESKLPGYVNASPLDIQVLTPMHKGALGDERLNEVLQKALNPPSYEKEEWDGRGSIFRVGDKVMQVKNNYQLTWEIRGKYGIVAQSGTGVFNGDIGTIRSIDMNAEIVEIEYEEGKLATYPFSMMDEVKLAYAITIHKSQGSEYPAIVIPLLSGPKMLMNRNLLYTAITRAKACVVIVGSKEVFKQMIQNDWEAYRYSSLCERIREIEEGI